MSENAAIIRSRTVMYSIAALTWAERINQDRAANRRTIKQEQEAVAEACKQFEDMGYTRVTITDPHTWDGYRDGYQYIFTPHDLGTGFYSTEIVQIWERAVSE